MKILKYDTNFTFSQCDKWKILFSAKKSENMYPYRNIEQT